MTEDEAVKYFRYVSSFRKAESYDGRFYSNVSGKLLTAEEIKEEMFKSSEYPAVITGENQEKFDARQWLLMASFERMAI